MIFASLFLLWCKTVTITNSTNSWENLSGELLSGDMLSGDILSGELLSGDMLSGDDTTITIDDIVDTTWTTISWAKTTNITQEKLKALIEKRKEEIKVEETTQKDEDVELTEKDIQLLESILDGLSK